MTIIIIIRIAAMTHDEMSRLYVVLQDGEARPLLPTLIGEARPLLPTLTPGLDPRSLLPDLYFPIFTS